MAKLITWLICLNTIVNVVHPAALLPSESTKSGTETENLLDEKTRSNTKNVLDNRKTESHSTVNMSQYYREREVLLSSEVKSIFGSDIVLTQKEEMANKVIMKAKEDELNVGFHTIHLFNPSRHIFEVLDTIKQSKLFQIIKKMPKGGVLHAHETAMCSTDYVVSLTYWPNLWQKMSTKTNQIKTFRFGRNEPQSSNDSSHVWRLVKDVRAEMGASDYDEHVRNMFTLYDKDVDPKLQFKNADEIWNRFQGMFDKITPLLTYAPVREEYYKQALKEMQDDGVQYLEFRGTLSKLYDLDGNAYSEGDILEIYQQSLEEFKRKNPFFIGSKLVYAPRKSTSNETVAHYFNAVRKLHEKYPTFLAGFDLVGQEDKAPGLLSFAESILKLPADLKFFFHAGETNWFGSVDENLIDAVLLGSRRIGHGYALTKHPKLIDLVKSNDIAIEVNPISNQVLKLVDDYRNHPASVFMAQNVPIVISSDDPSFFEVSPLSHDFYITFLGIASRHSDLRILKKLAINSIQYSSLNDVEKTAAFVKWQVKWDAFIEDLVQNHQ